MPKTVDDNFVFKKFALWLDKAKKQYDKLNMQNYNAFCLSSCVNNLPSSRMVLLKSFSHDGFTFYTNSQSQKGAEITENPNVAMLFHWNVLQRQIRVSGVCSEVSSNIADEYFASRPYLSKVGAWASQQSREMNGILELSKNVIYYSAKYPIDVPRPPYWNGYNIAASKIEFWVEKPARLHIRKVYEKISLNQWTEKILFP
ncbi:MAG: pyridoxamine 5'-phosphate oxidase [Alphaproteobacteria bacterium]|jgi:pyridoxamine 5'-phosphate oxidase|nr:pyridoxamine 5'-phosphate oxidase [Alphaproteobacteria bacterium]